MNSLIQQNEYFQCPNCSNLIASFAPECSKCGLLASSEGIVELAATDKKNVESLNEAQSLVNFAVGPAIYLLLAFIFAYILPPASVTLLFIWGISHGLFWWKLYKWNRNFGANDFPDENYTEALGWRGKACAFAVGGLVLAGLLIYSMI